MASDFKQQHHEEQEKSRQLQTPGLPQSGAPAPAAGADKSRTLLWSFAALFIAGAAVIVAFLLMKQKDSPEQPVDPSAMIVHEPKGAARAEEQETSRQLSGESVEQQQKRAGDHLARAKKQIRLRKWRAALFFLDQVLILDSEHSEARKLLAVVEGKASAQAAVASARKARRKRLAMRLRARRARPAAKPAAKPRPSASATKVKAAAKVASRVKVRVKQAGLQVTSKPEAMVYLDGIPLGRTPLKGIRLAPGLHNVKLVEKGYVSYVKEVTLESGKERHFEVKLRAVGKKPVMAAKKNATEAPVPTPKSAVASADKPVAAAPKPAPTTAGVNFLPRIVKVQVYDRDGKKTKELLRATGMVEQAAGRAAGKSAAGVTRALRKFLYGAHRGSITPIAIYPRRMGLIITNELNKGQSKAAISNLLVHLYRTKALKP